MIREPASTAAVRRCFFTGSPSTSGRHRALPAAAPRPANAVQGGGPRARRRGAAAVKGRYCHGRCDIVVSKRYPTVTRHVKVSSTFRNRATAFRNSGGRPAPLAVRPAWGGGLALWLAPATRPPGRLNHLTNPATRLPGHPGTPTTRPPGLPAPRLPGIWPPGHLGRPATLAISAAPAEPVAGEAGSSPPFPSSLGEAVRGWWVCGPPRSCSRGGVSANSAFSLAWCSRVWGQPAGGWSVARRS